jgi:hypothetical protein
VSPGGLVALGATIAGLPPTAWLMILAAGGVGLTIELVFYLRHRRRWSGSRERRGEGRR